MMHVCSRTCYTYEGKKICKLDPPTSQSADKPAINAEASQCMQNIIVNQDTLIDYESRLVILFDRLLGIQKEIDGVMQTINVVNNRLLIQKSDLIKLLGPVSDSNQVIVEDQIGREG